MRPRQIFRFVAGLIILAAVTGSYFDHRLTQTGFADSFMAQWNFFSFFTIQTNLVIAIWFLGAAFFPNSRWATGNTKAALVEWGAVTAIVFWSLLYNDVLGRSTLGFLSTSSLHILCVVLPLVELLTSPPRREIHLRGTLSWLIFPLAWAAYTFIRGPLVGWFPYWFIDPAKVGSIWVVAGIVAGFVVFYFAIGAGIYSVLKTLKARLPVPTRAEG